MLLTSCISPADGVPFLSRIGPCPVFCYLWGIPSQAIPLLALNSDQSCGSRSRSSWSKIQHMYIRSLKLSKLDEIQPQIDTEDTCQKLSFTFQKWLQICKNLQYDLKSWCRIYADMGSNNCPEKIVVEAKQIWNQHKTEESMNKYKVFILIFPLNPSFYIDLIYLLYIFYIYFFIYLWF